MSLGRFWLIAAFAWLRPVFALILGQDVPHPDTAAIQAQLAGLPPMHAPDE